ncbi:hypothetical protein RDWZM_007670 [Blomia tropicalis]|uniref:Uncharacterized protein n=1 Tax=Blomia tropicalis TaxID=40697 RepID=A0A9Q0LXV9_BLOTA|nr:hypothetical protein RDWZM_007670 [Blomia tropicalis]
MTPPILNEVEDDSGRQQTGEVEYELEESATDQIQKKNKDSDDDGEEDTETGECEENNESEFTKPTINQIRKDKKETTISYSEKINDKEFEQMYDELNELNSGMKTLKHSYGSIIKSLCAIQNRRTKKKIQREMQKREGKLSFLATLSTCDVADLKSRSCLEQSEKYDIERFINPMTREETFNALFDEIEEVRKCTEHLRINFFDPRGRFLRDKYDEQEEYRLNRSKFNEIRLWIKKLATVVDEIVRNYNDDLLNLFRL